MTERKKRHAGLGLRTRGEDEATRGKKSRTLRPKPLVEAARKLAATRAKDAERQATTERENSENVARSSETTARWAKTVRERTRRRAEIYAINAVMRYVYARVRVLDFVAYLVSLKSSLY